MFSKKLKNCWKKQIKKKENQKFTNDINIILKKYGIKETINHTHLVRVKTLEIDNLSLSFFQNKNEDVNRLAKIVENYIWNNAEENIYVYHFTKEDVAKSIESSKKFECSFLYNAIRGKISGSKRCTARTSNLQKVEY